MRGIDAVAGDDDGDLRYDGGDSDCVSRMMGMRWNLSICRAMLLMRMGRRVALLYLLLQYCCLLGHDGAYDDGCGGVSVAVAVVVADGSDDGGGGDGVIAKQTLGPRDLFGWRVIGNENCFHCHYCCYCHRRYW